MTLRSLQRRACAQRCAHARERRPRGRLWIPRVWGEDMEVTRFAQIAYPQGYVCMNIPISNILDDAVRRKVESLGHLRHSEPAIVGGPKRRLDALHLATILQVGWTRRLGIGTRHP